MKCSHFLPATGGSLSVLFISAMAFADSATTDLGEVIVTADRSARSVNDTLSSVSILTRDDIDAIQAVDIVDVLRLQPGINISRTGNAGNQTSIFLRGSESDHALVMIDGVRVASSVNGAFDWSNLPVDQVERIEIVRGSRSALYGSEAIGGVIQIFTRRDGKPYAGVTIGKYGSKKGSAGISVGNKTRFSANISAENSEGFSSTLPTSPFYHADKDGFKKRSATMALSHQLNNKTKLGLDLLYSNNDSEFDQGVSNTRLDTQSAWLESDNTEMWSQRIRLSRTKNDLASSFEVFTTRRHELDWQHDITLSENVSAIAGLNYRKEDAISPDYDRDVSNKALFVNLNYQQGKAQYDASLRYDDHSMAGSETTGQLAAGYDISAASSIFASYGTAFKAPTMNELFSPGFDFGGGSFFYSGNPDLKPETSETIEIGLKSRLSHLQSLNLSLYQTDINDMINYTGPTLQLANIDEVQLKGLEMAYTGSHQQWDWGVNATLQRTEDKLTGDRLLRRPNTKLNLTLGYDVSTRTYFGLDATHASSRDDFGGIKLDGYTLLNLSATHKLGKHINLGLRVENATDEGYELASGYATAGRAAYVTLNYQ